MISSLWRVVRYWKASESEVVLGGGRRTGSRSGLGSFRSCIRGLGALVGVIGATIVGGDVGGVDSGVVGGDSEERDEEADSGLHESFRRQLQELLENV